MAAWLIDKIAGRFYNGMCLAEVPQELHTCYSIHGYLNRVLNNTFQIDPESELFYGKLNLFYIHLKLPSNIDEISSALLDYLHKSGVLNLDVKVECWAANSPCCFLECIIKCICNDNVLLHFKIEFRARGAIKVEPLIDDL